MSLSNTFSPQSLRRNGQVAGCGITTRWAAAVFTASISRWEYLSTVHVFPAHRSWDYTFPSFLVSAVKLHPFLLSFPPIQISPVVFWKGGYIRCYCMISQSLSSQPLKSRRADQSWVIPAVTTTRTLPPFSLKPVRILPAPLCNWSNFMSAQQIFRALLRPTQGRSPVRVDLRVFVLVEAFENKQEDRGPQSVKWWDFRGGGKKQLPRAWWTLCAWAEVGLREQISRMGGGDTISGVVDIDERELRIKHK